MKNSLYIIVQGPWLFNVQIPGADGSFTINALTVSAPPMPDPMQGPIPHKYQYIDPRAPLDANHDLPIIGDIPHNQPVNISVGGLATPRPIASDLFKKMKKDGTEIFYDKAARSFPQSAEYQLNLPSPDRIFPLGMIQGATVKIGGKPLNGWPSALAFVYFNWSTYSAGDLESVDSGSLQGSVAVRLFRIAHWDSVPADKEYEHAKLYFNKLVKQVDCGSACSLPTVEFPTPPALATIDLGAPAEVDIRCLDLGDPRLCGMKKSSSNGRLFSATLVNCASGGGGVGGLGCC